MGAFTSHLRLILAVVVAVCVNRLASHLLLRHTALILPRLISACLAASPAVLIMGEAWLQKLGVTDRIVDRIIILACVLGLIIGLFSGSRTTSRPRR